MAKISWKVLIGLAVFLILIQQAAYHNPGIGARITSLTDITGAAIVEDPAAIGQEGEGGGGGNCNDGTDCTLCSTKSECEASKTSGACYWTEQNGPLPNCRSCGSSGITDCSNCTGLSPTCAYTTFGGGLCTYEGIGFGETRVCGNNSPTASSIDLDKGFPNITSNVNVTLQSTADVNNDSLQLFCDINQPLPNNSNTICNTTLGSTPFASYYNDLQDTSGNKVLHDNYTFLSCVFNPQTESLVAGISYKVQCRLYDGQNYSITHNHTIQPQKRPQITSFSSTSLDEDQNLSDLSALWLQSSGTGTINWTGTNFNIAGGTNLDSFVKIFSGGASVDTANLDSSLNSTARITISSSPSDPCVNPKIYKAEGTFTTSKEIFGDPSLEECQDCTLISCSNGVMVFDVTSFTGYAVGANSELVIWDETDFGMPYGSKIKYPNNDVEFFANYTNNTDSSPITTASCNISFATAPNGPFAMSYDSVKTFYTYTRSFPSAGTVNWNATCNDNAFIVLNASDTATIWAVGAAPEFNTKAILIAVLLSAVGLIAVRKLRK